MFDNNKNNDEQAGTQVPFQDTNVPLENDSVVPEYWNNEIPFSEGEERRQWNDFSADGDIPINDTTLVENASFKNKVPSKTYEGQSEIPETQPETPELESFLPTENLVPRENNVTPSRPVLDDELPVFMQGTKFVQKIMIPKMRIMSAKTKIGMLAVILAVLGFGISYFTNKDSSGVIDPPVIQPASIIKEVPIDPQGMEIEHLDKAVYGAVNDVTQGTEEKIEKLLPKIEKAIIIEKTSEKATLKKIITSDKKASGKPAEKTTKKVVAKKVVAKKVVAKKVVAKKVVAKKVVAKKNVAKKNVAKKVAVKKTVENKVSKNSAGKVSIAVAKVVGNSWRIQLASVGSVISAKKVYAKALSKYSVLKNSKLYVQSVEVNNKKYHRVQAIGFATKSLAEKSCKTIKSQGGQCLVKKP